MIPNTNKFNEKPNKPTTTLQEQLTLAETRVRLANAALARAARVPNTPLSNKLPWSA
jgi:hypothetical protein